MLYACPQCRTVQKDFGSHLQFIAEITGTLSRMTDSLETYIITIDVAFHGLLGLRRLNGTFAEIRNSTRTVGGHSAVRYTS